MTLMYTAVAWAILFMYLLCGLFETSSASRIASVSFGADTFVTLEALTEKELNVTITCSNSNGGSLRFESVDQSVFKVGLNTSSFPCFPADNVTNATVSVFVEGIALGIADLRAVYTNSTGNYTVGTHLVKVMRKPLFTSTVLAVVLIIWICVSYITMGSKIDLKVIWQHLKRPHGVLIGLLCQFLIMPPLSFALAKVFALDDASAIGLILDGTCPGGWFSNVFTLLLNCDFNLSLTMTFSSTLLALGMMPLNLFIYTRYFIDHNEQLRTPYAELAMQLAFLVIPVLIGLGLSHKFPKLKRIFDRMLRPMLVGLIFVSLGVGIPTQYYVVLATWKIWLAAAVFPLIGGALGFAIARVTCLDTKSAVTIAIETGVQNSLLAIAVVALYYEQPEIDLIGRIPALIGLLVVMEGGILALLKEVNDYFRKKSTVPHSELVEQTDCTRDGALSDSMLDRSSAGRTLDEPHVELSRFG